MIWRAGLAVALAAAAGTGTAGAGTSSRQIASHCKVQEQVVYACRFGRKAASLCLGKQSIHYRYGPIGRPEIDLASAPDWSNVRTHQLFSHALAQKHVRMSRGSISYIVHFGETGRLADIPGKRISGIVVMDGPDKVWAELPCKGSARIDSRAFDGIGQSAPAGWEGGEELDGPFDGYF